MIPKKRYAWPRGLDMLKKTICRIFCPLPPEEQRLAFQKTTHPYNLPANLGSAPELGEIVLQQKGVVLDSLLEDHLVAEASEDPKQHQAVSELRLTKQRMMQLRLETPNDLSDQTVKNWEADGIFPWYFTELFGLIRLLTWA